ncbi:zinc finger, C2H2 type family protein (macronuclear) [Tetrahymena thermophila SB210]|uniref:Zinc finger, C2H2 type family protein n=1 Tax=Tetrahymena thermophila (strain SB210) TaxID=312017 RepID=I7LZN8_TETTS|nr:zinc finger, C2H2 type family protein [Tetrahymena thermophila SB210]EAR84436.3 zinc finger, C2H2 type family protein [Tetrahymena thermophila SB210]|eukprot:XP_001032099.3 zinc finger, C2H2 type family protein [Tetrahymena thermophila SB210]
MSKKRPQEDSNQDQDYQQEESQKNSSANDEDDKKKENKFMCKCGKGYGLQSSLFNHIRIKHDDNKAEWAKERNVKPGRPKNTETSKDKAQKNPQKKEKKPEGVDNNTWDLLQLYRNPLFNNLIIKFGDKMKENYTGDTSVDKVEKNNWEIYEERRKDIYQTINFCVKDRNDISEKTDFLLRAWAQLLNPANQVSIFIAFVSEYIQKFYDLPDEKKDKIEAFVQKIKINDKETIQDYKNISEKIREVLNKEYKLEKQDGQAQDQQSNQIQGEEEEEDSVNDNNQVEDMQQQQQQLQQQQDQQDLEIYEQQKHELNNGLQNNQVIQNYNQDYEFQQNQQMHYNNYTYQYDNQINNQNNHDNYNNNNNFDNGDFQINELLGQTDYVQEDQPNQNNVSYFNQQSFKFTSYNMIDQISKVQNNISFNNQNSQMLFNCYSQYQNNLNEEEYNEDNENEDNDDDNEDNGDEFNQINQNTYN